ncbi:protein of unknown function [Streptococcus thermophilus]|uniref:Uncharacterized protein n=1 Tax=Streptococcus thermophilus TaxID=1308 RepID=A0AAN2DAB0_STRTR|nr:protein of unknown function [Streptococcus thermophilus]CAD0141790.1 protein of unknown function [Streptococcus thermophilus]CAD0155458.1 protein of unknown function [Streptococcus thermophilus]CAD0167499.1 protein of unknown function [Streptococcus thermophilus]CAD0169516.1 protein of unknown function [Streptococcus thermophilus]
MVAAAISSNVLYVGLVVPFSIRHFEKVNFKILFIITFY